MIGLLLYVQPILLLYIGNHCKKIGASLAFKNNFEVDILKMVTIS